MSTEAMRTMNVAWIHLWFLFLKSNRDYAAYCKARRKKQKAECTKLEKQFPKIAEVYDDFGTVYGVKFQDWYKAHEHLFYAATIPKVAILNKVPKKLDPTSIYIRIPYPLPVSKATKQANEAIRAAYNEAPPALKQGISNAKYSLSVKTPSHRTWLSTMKCYAAWQYSREIDGNKLSQKERVSKILALAETYADQYWDWSSNAVEVHLDYDQLRSTVGKLRKQADNIIANTIYGVFPVKTKNK